jgi:hypothetical protein
VRTLNEHPQFVGKLVSSFPASVASVFVLAFHILQDGGQAMSEQQVPQPTDSNQAHALTPPGPQNAIAENVARQERTTAPAKWVFGYMLPLYLIIATLCVIALPNALLTTARAPVQPIAAAVSKATPPPDISMTHIAKLAIDARIDGIKESYDRVFSLIAAMAALLVFFGFKGIETFNDAKARSQVTIDLAEAAARKTEAAHALAETKAKAALELQEKYAEDTRELARSATEAVKNFVGNHYTKDVTAQINVVQGMILVELAELYSKMVKKCNVVDQDSTLAYRDYLKYSLFFLEQVTNHPEGVDKKIVSQAYITQGFAHKRLGKLEIALRLVKTAFEKYDDRDYSGYFNAACYCCLLAAEATRGNDSGSASELEEQSLRHLRIAIELNENARKRALGDDDFLHFRERKHAEFLTLVTVVVRAASHPS